ncbi:MAG: PD40 domain-containing protein [Acidobacteria bacterium]|nr:PD40 domain-containing protein [Acidobacteriota bacterium]MBI3426265.1 PD40 domain-containing protein [Acidobacteriota bacterium]
MKNIPMVMMRGLLAGLIVLGAVSAARAQAEAVSESNYAVFVSQREGAAELFAINLQTHQVSQLTSTGRGHLIPSASSGSRELVFAAQEGSNFELFTAQVASAWRSRRPTLVGLQRLTMNGVDEVSPTISASGALVAFASGAGLELMTVNGGGRQTVLANDGTHRDYCPALSPDGTQVAFVSDRSGVEEIWLINLATGALRQLTAAAQPVGGLNWSADGRQLVFTSANTKTTLTGIALADVRSGSFRLLTDGGDSSPALSPRGDRLLFTSQRDGDAELYLLSLNTGALERLTHSAGLDDGAIFLVEPALPQRRP